MKKLALIFILFVSFNSKAQNFFIVNKAQAKSIDSLCNLITFKESSFKTIQLKDSTKFCVPFEICQTELQTYCLQNTKRKKIFDNIFLYVPLKQLTISDFKTDSLIK